jgi:triosephosphate isomerase
MRAPLIVGNWKMNGLQSDCFELARRVAEDLRSPPAAVEVVLAPPYTGLMRAKQALETSEVRLAAQNCHWEESGAFTGEISPSMIKEIGCEFVILGHSERRHILNESDATVAQKIAAALKSGLRPIICVGETLDQRQAGHTGAVIERQLQIALKPVSKPAIEQIEIAYEPVWAIGTGQNAAPQQVGQVHEQIRQLLVKTFSEQSGKGVRILYGGSVKPDNAGSLLKTAEVNGLLVGGASLKAETFLPIVRSFAAE